MLAARSLRLAGTRCVNPALCARSTKIRFSPTLQTNPITWYTRPLAAAYSKDVKPGVLFSSSCLCSFLTSNNIHNCNFNSSLASNTLASIAPLTEADTKSTKPSPPLIGKEPLSPTSSPPLTGKESLSPSSSAPLTGKEPLSSSSSPSASNTTEDAKSQIFKSCTGVLGDNGVKLPSRDQVESFIFKSLVYLWDFTYYVFCLSVKLVETYIFNNSTVQHYWKQLLKRMEDARKELKTK